ncbi:hypothetical protein [Adhaeribacter terreus]|uniref:Uncharacterized protein n=1 Tax=Adhaeribacter terreus TaxID=529703 RepID=A0ABW0E9K9_9BACT
MSSSVLQADILTFLTSIQNDIHDMEGLLDAIRQENRRAEIYGQQNISELMEISVYQWQLEQVEMKLKAPSLIKITFASEGEKVREPKTEEEKIEALLLNMIMRIIRYNGHLSKEKQQ